MIDPVEMQERYEAVMMRQLKEHGIFEGVVAMFNAKRIETERLREALHDCHHVLHKLMAIVPGNDAAVDEMVKVMTKARVALGEGK